MKYFRHFRRLIPALLIWLFTGCSAPEPDYADGRMVQSFNTGWKFVHDDPAGAEAVRFNDGNWRELNVPHDWSIEGEFDRDNPTGRGGGYLPAGIGWYRKSFAVPKSAEGRRLWINFDGLMSSSDIYINGQHLDHRPYGYVPISYELTPYLNYGKENVLAVRLDNTRQPASRW